MSSRLRFRGKMMKVIADTGLPFLVHENVLLELPGVSINTVPDNEGGEAQVVDLGAWNEATVERLIEYVYTGDYHCPDPTPTDTPTVTPTPSSESGLRATEGPSTIDATSPPLDTTPSLARPLTPLPQCFHAGPDPAERLSQANTFKIKYFDPAKHDFEAVFLTHAQIYSLASYLRIEPLWTLALQRLLRTLTNIGTVKSNWPMVLDFADLVRFSYEKTSSSEDPLRGIITQFAALNFTALNNDDMKNCIRDCGEFASELMEKVCRRLTVSETELRTEQEQARSFKHQLEIEKKTSASLQAKLVGVERTNESLAKSLALRDSENSYKSTDKTAIGGSPLSTSPPYGYRPVNITTTSGSYTSRSKPPPASSSSSANISSSQPGAKPILGSANYTPVATNVLFGFPR